MRVVQNLFVIIAYVITTLSMQVGSLKYCRNYKPRIHLPVHMTALPCDYSQRFSNVARLYTSDSTQAGTILKDLFSTRVCIVGLGGVGSWVAEALARSGVSKLTLIDADEVCISNINRQVAAQDSNIGRFKVDSLKERILDINPAAEVVTCYEFARPTNVHELLHNSATDNIENSHFDYVIDAVDDVVDKAAIIDSCVRSGTPVLTSGGAGGLTDPSRITVSDLAHAQGDNLLMRVRRRLRKEYGYPLSPQREGMGEVHTGKKRVRRWKILAVHSEPTGSCRYLTEQKPSADTSSESNEDLTGGSVSVAGSDGSTGSGLRKCDYSFGNACFSAGTMGFMLASCVVNAICGGRDQGTMKDRVAVRPKRLGHYFRGSLHPTAATTMDSASTGGDTTIGVPVEEAECHCGKEQAVASDALTSTSVSGEEKALRCRQVEGVEARLTAAANIAGPKLQSQSEWAMFDAHCHLQLDPLFPHTSSAIALATKHNICGVSVCGTAPGEDWQRVRQLFESNRNYVVPSFGLHPWRIAKYIAEAGTRGDTEGGAGWAQELEELLLEIPQAHVGECGLDKAVLRSGVPYEVQEGILLQHLVLASKHRRALTLHCVSGCWDRLLTLLKQQQKKVRPKQVKGSGLEQATVATDNMPPAIVLHSCNSMPKEMVAQFLRLCAPVYFSLSAGGRAGLPSKTMEMARLVPSDRLLIETDSPDQLPGALRAAPSVDRDCGPTPSADEGLLYNEPALLVLYCCQLSEALSVSVTDLAQQTTRNAKHAYQLS